MENLPVLSNGLISMNVLETLFSARDKEKARIEELSNILENESVVHHFFNKNGTHLYAHTFSAEPAIKSLDASYWADIISKTDILDCMTAAKRNELQESITELKTPPFTRDVVLSTMEDLLLRREDHFIDKIDGIFRSLSGEHITNSPSGFRSKMILNHMLDSSPYIAANHRRCEVLNDFRSVLAKLSRSKHKDGNYIRFSSYCDISRACREEEFGEWISFDNDTFRMKLYKKGTAHLEVNDDLALVLNKYLAKKYPAAIPDTELRPKKVVKRPVYQNQSLSNDVLGRLSSVYDVVRYKDRTAGVYRGDLSKEDFEQTVRVLKMIGYKVSSENKNGATLSVNYNSVPVLSHLLRVGAIPDQKSHQFYPTPDKVLEIVREQLSNVYTNDEHLEDGFCALEPSAGNGAIADTMKAFGVKTVCCVEVNPLLAKVLTSKEYNTTELDFLTLDDNAYTGYDLIVMNPPYANKEYLRHFQHALNFLKPSGHIICVMPKTFEEKQPRVKLLEVADAGAGHFEDTKISVNVLCYQKNV